MVPAGSPRDKDLIERRELLDGPGVTRALRRIAHEIVEKNHGAAGLALGSARYPGATNAAAG